MAVLIGFSTWDHSGAVVSGSRVLQLVGARHQPYDRRDCLAPQLLLPLELMRQAQGNLVCHVG